VITWQFNLFFLQQVIEDPITFSDVENVVNLILPTFRSWLQARAYEWFTFGCPLPNSIRLHTCRPLCRPMTRYYILPC
jgi:hypothetical protein